MKFIDLFAGIGGFREGLERNGFECVGWVEVDKFKQQAYRTVHDTEGEWHKDDIKSIRPEELPKADIYTGGFPCQSFSIAGNRGGFEDTRGTLFFEVARLARARKPKYLLLENVKGLLNHDKGNTFSTILNTLAELGYEWQYQVLNSKDFSTKEYPTPQNRERVFIVANLREEPRPKIFPFRETSKRTLKELTRGMSQGYRVYDINGLSVTLAGEAGGLGAKTGLYNVKACIASNRLDKSKMGEGLKKMKMIRKLTPLETFRLQGFPDEWYHKCREEGISDTQMYRCAGDAVTVNVVQEIGRRLKDG